MCTGAYSVHTDALAKAVLTLPPSHQAVRIDVSNFGVGNGGTKHVSSRLEMVWELYQPPTNIGASLKLGWERYPPPTNIGANLKLGYGIAAHKNLRHSRPVCRVTPRFVLVLANNGQQLRKSCEYAKPASQQIDVRERSEPLTVLRMLVRTVSPVQCSLFPACP